jgi:hydroxymethylbilane synthase
LPRTIRIGTRGSHLALTQTHWVEAQLQARHPNLSTDVVIIKTSGDKLKDVPLAQVGGKGLFIKEIEEALLAGEIDLAIHSLKDMPAEMPPGCVLGAVPPREDCRDAFISQRYAALAEIPAGGRVGTGSLRRKVQILHCWPDLEVVHLRGNVETRLRKLETEGLDAIILAAAGLKRLGLGHIPRGFLDETEMLPAIGQGALGLEVRADDQEMLELLRPMNHVPSQVAVTAERAFLARLEGSCVVPVAALGQLEGNSLNLSALISDLEGRQVLQDRLVGPPEEANYMGRRLAEMLLDRGGRNILQEIFGRPLQ